MLMVEPKAAPSFEGLAVAAFESRRTAEITTLIERFGGVPRAAPSMREAPLEDNSAMFRFAERLFAGGIDVVIFMTGVGVTMMIETLERRYSRDELVRALNAATVAARGSKTVRALASLGVTVRAKAPEPNTWREVVIALENVYDGRFSGLTIAVQEYGEPNEQLAEELARRGAQDIVRVPVYRWTAPKDAGPLMAVAREIISGQIPIVLFTNAVQVRHLFEFADAKKDELRAALNQCVICSVGPSCSETIVEHGLVVDFESAAHKMGSFIHEAAGRAPELLRVKQRTSASRIVAKATAAAASGGDSSRPEYLDSRFMRACRREPVDATPVWLMRQAGRYQRRYRELRASVPFLELCKNAELASEVTVSAALRIGADAAIIFADLLLVAEPMGFRLDYDRPGGPWVSPRIENAADVEKLLKIEPGVDALDYLFDAVRRARRALPKALPLIGFAGAPFTLASYLIEGGPSKTFRRTKALMLSDPGVWRALMDYLARALASCANGQIKAGAQAVQVFDSWVGCLAPDDYRQSILPHMKTLFSSLPPDTPAIHFGVGTGALLEMMREGGGSTIGLDFRVQLDEAWRRLGSDISVQGNLEPAVLFAGTDMIRQRVVRVLEQAGGRAGHIFNLGHGVLPETPEESVADLVKIVHEESARRITQE